jgi:uncharacterized protein (UPF0305 family)
MPTKYLLNTSTLLFQYISFFLRDSFLKSLEWMQALTLINKIIGSHYQSFKNKTKRLEWGTRNVEEWEGEGDELKRYGRLDASHFQSINLLPNLVQLSWIYFTFLTTSTVSPCGLIFPNFFFQNRRCTGDSPIWLYLHLQYFFSNYWNKE